MTDKPSISARTIDALLAIAKAGHDIADALRETGRAGEGQGGGYVAADPECSCAACDPGLFPGEAFNMLSRMSVCPDCGNKRCPKAADHAKWECSGSNDTGQVGVLVDQAQIDAQEPAEQRRAPSGGVGTSSTLSARLRALIPATYTDDGYFGVTALEIGEFADEAHRLEVHARVVEQSLRTARAEGDEAQAQVAAIRAAIDREASHGDAITRCNLVAERFRTVLGGAEQTYTPAQHYQDGVIHLDEPVSWEIGKGAP